MSNSLYKKKIADLVEVFNNIRVPLSANQRLKLEKKFPYYGAQGIVDYVDNFLFDGEYLLVAEDGENLRSNTQNICNLVKGKFWVNNHAHILKANKENDNKYLYYNFNRIKFEPYVTGSSQPKLNKENLLNIVTSVHLLKEQQKIASVLSALDDKIELNNRINAELEAMAKTLYDYWFVQFDFPNSPPLEGWQNSKNFDGVVGYKSSGGKMVYNETLKREIPEGWEVKTVGELVNIFDSKRIPLSKSEREKKKGIFPYYGATEIMDYINDFIFDGEYILLAEDGSVMNSEGFPILQYIYGKTWVNNHAHVLQSKQIEYTEYLYKLLEMIPVILIKSGSIQMKINQDNLLNYKLLVAPETLILKYSKFAKSIRQKLIQNQKQNQELSALRDWLLPMLMNGQVKVGEIIL